LSGGLNRSWHAAKLLPAIEEHCLYVRESQCIAVACLLEGNEDFKRRVEASLSRPTQLTHF